MTMENRDKRRPQLDLSNLKEKFPEVFGLKKGDAKGPLVSITSASQRAGIGKPVIKKLIEDGYLEAWKEGHVTVFYYRDLLKATWDASNNGEGPLPGKPGRPTSSKGKQD